MILKNRRVLRHVGLFIIIFRLLIPDPLKIVVDHLHRRFVENQFFPQKLAERLFRQIVLRRPQTAGDEKEITVLHSELHYAFQPAGIVSHRIVIQHVYPHLIQLLREISRIGIDHLPEKKFCSHRNNR